jgi:hypothetical protein
MHSVLAVTTDPKQSALTTSPPRFSMRVHYFPVSHVYSVAHSTCGKPSTLRSELAMAFATTNLTLISLCGLLPTKYKDTWPLPCAFNAQGFFYTALQGTGFLLTCASRHRIYCTLCFKAQDLLYTALQGTVFYRRRLPKARTRTPTLSNTVGTRSITRFIAFFTYIYMHNSSLLSLHIYMHNFVVVCFF